MTAPHANRGRTRALLALGALLVLVAGAAVVGVVVSGDSDEDLRWDALVGFEPESSELVLYDDAGEEVERIDTGLDELVSAETRGAYVLAHGAAETAVIVDAGDGAVVWKDDGLEERPHWVSGSIAPVAVIGAPEGGELRVVDPRSGTDVALGASVGLDQPGLQPVGVLVSPDGTVLAAGDFRTPQVVLADLDSGETHTVPGSLAALGDDVVVAFDAAPDDDPDQDGPRRYLARFVDTGGTEIGTAPLPDRFHRVLVDGDDTVVGIAGGSDGDDGDAADPVVVFGVAPGDDEPRTLATLDDVDAVDRVTALPGADRLAVTTGDGRTLLVDTEGEQIAEVPGEQIPFPVDLHRAECVVISGGDLAGVHDLETGEQVVETPRPDLPALRAAPDGCAFAAQGTIASPDGVVEIDERAVAVVAPDGRAALVRESGRATELVDLTDPDADPVSIDAIVVGFVQR